MKARNHKTLERAKYAFMLLQYLASGPHRGNQLAIAQTDIVSVVNRVLAVTTFKTKKGEHGDPGFRDAKHGKKKKKKKFEGGETKLAVWQQGRENIYHDLGERDIAASPAKYINESVTTFLLSLLEGQQKERVVTRLLTSLEWRHIESHLTALHIIMSMKDNRLMNLTKTALEVEIAATEKKLEEIGVEETNGVSFRFYGVNCRIRQFFSYKNSQSWHAPFVLCVRRLFGPVETPDEKRTA
jgi:hypothetical protein